MSLSSIKQLKAILDNWADHESECPDPDGLDWLAASFGEHYPKSRRLPFFYPNFEGGVRAEWAIKNFEVSLEMNLETHQGYYHSLDHESGIDYDRILDLNDATDWRWLVNDLDGM